MPRLMIVDDEPEITAMLKRYFVREGYETVTALTGAERAGHQLHGPNRDL